MTCANSFSGPWAWYRYEKVLKIPQTTTDESLRNGRMDRVRSRVKLRKQLNYQIYPIDDYRLDILTIKTEDTSDNKSTYKRDYVPYRTGSGINCTLNKVPDAPDWLFNRRSVNPFEMNTSTSAKFMDDKLFNVTEARRKIDFFRQLRNRHFNLV